MEIKFPILNLGEVPPVSVDNTGIVGPIAGKCSKKMQLHITHA